LSRAEALLAIIEGTRQAPYPLGLVPYPVSLDIQLRQEQQRLIFQISLEQDATDEQEERLMSILFEASDFYTEYVKALERTA
jgi:hypothetical protein